MKRGLSRFLIASAIVLAGVVVVDILVGVVMNRLLPEIGNEGDTGRTYYSLYKVNEPVLIIGSSRANHHYVPQIISDSLGLPVRNIGRDGCFFSYNCCVINSILDRYSPELIIWENGGSYLNEGGRDPLENLYPYYLSNEHIHTCINSYTDGLDRLPLYSNLYRYNSVIHRIVMRYLNKAGEEDGLNGYMPLKPRQWTPKSAKIADDKEAPKICDIKERQFISVLSRVKEKGVRIVVVDSPEYATSEKESESVRRMKTICDSLGVPFFNNVALEGFCGNIELFNDNTHMNEIGADLYTQKFLEQISENR